jgi:hypothetical protein
MATQEMYKYDAMLHLVWSVAQEDETFSLKHSGQGWKAVTKEEDAYLDLIRAEENIDINWTDFNAKRVELGHNRELIIDEACKALRGCGKEWKIKCLGYMRRMAWISQENDLENNMSDKEFQLVLRAQRELGLTDNERINSSDGLRTGK